MIKISIITCTFNSEKWIKKNIDSVSNQNFNNFEHIFIDGYSSDNTINIIKEYQSKFPDKVKYFQFLPKGISNAMNIGIKKAEGTYLIHLHSDDYFNNYKILNNVWHFLQKNNFPDWIYGRAVFTNQSTGKSRIIPHRKIYHRVIKNLLLLTNYIPHQSVFIKKAIFTKFGNFREDFKNSMDYEYWIKISDETKSKFYPKIICNYSLHTDSQSSKFKDRQTLENRIIKNTYVKNPLFKIILNAISFIDSKRKLI